MYKHTLRNCHGSLYQINPTCERNLPACRLEAGGRDPSRARVWTAAAVSGPAIPCVPAKRCAVPSTVPCISTGKKCVQGSCCCPGLWSQYTEIGACSVCCGATLRLITAILRLLSILSIRRPSQFTFSSSSLALEQLRLAAWRHGAPSAQLVLGTALTSVTCLLHCCELLAVCLRHDVAYMVCCKRGAWLMRSLASLCICCALEDLALCFF